MFAAVMARLPPPGSTSGRVAPPEVQEEDEWLDENSDAEE